MSDSGLTPKEQETIQKLEGFISYYDCEWICSYD